MKIIWYRKENLFVVEGQDMNNEELDGVRRVFETVRSQLMNEEPALLVLHQAVDFQVVE